MILSSRKLDIILNEEEQGAVDEVCYLLNEITKDMNKRNYRTLSGDTEFCLEEVEDFIILLEHLRDNKAIIY